MKNFFRNHIPVRLAYNSFEPQCDGWCLSPYSRSSPIIFLHGLTSCKETWGNIPQMFANELKRKGAEHPLIGVVRKFGGGEPAQVSSSSSDRGSKLRGPSQNSPRVAPKTGR
ncbi:hypothetical protein AVEN_203311-1 [Araneus ventricosus]|uniref:Uncharacterized protein n=1 Tax=Araneus ventricosus TaxID=182803 RepID=A0A4Y2NE90_ARAVE|nr:hypothetical protein AVEN_138415-1 [Araneus ventricosus]GBN36943.1 hypothetical protein AVEN_203311-1 [Araneus ventricosus]